LGAELSDKRRAPPLKNLLPPTLYSLFRGGTVFFSFQKKQSIEHRDLQYETTVS
jgi:hypothetical protein